MTKKRVSLTLPEEIVERVDVEADEKDLNRSEMVEEALDAYFAQRGLETAVVLCGDPELKSMESYRGKTVLEHILEHLESEHISRAVLLVGQNRQEIEERFGSSFGEIAIEYVSEEEPRGTAAALEQVESKIERPFVVLNGHVITDVDLSDMLRLHNEEDSVATIALTSVEEPSKYGAARLKGRKILGFEEKPEKGEEPSRLINAGTYILDPEIFEYLQSDSLEEVFETLSSRSLLSGYIYGGKWLDVDEV